MTRQPVMPLTTIPTRNAIRMSCGMPPCVLHQIVEIFGGGRADGGCREQEREAGGRRPVQVAQQTRGDGDAAARSARHDRQNLRKAHRHGIGKIEMPQIFLLAARRARPTTGTRQWRSSSRRSHWACATRFRPDAGKESRRRRWEWSPRPVSHNSPRLRASAGSPPTGMPRPCATTCTQSRKK